MKAADLSASIRQFIRLSQEMDGGFCPGKSARKDVFAMASWLRAHLPSRQDGIPVCLAAEDKAVIAAALLASLAGGPVLLLPYAFSDAALAGLRQSSGFRVLISDVPRDVPQDVQLLCPPGGLSGKPLAEYPIDPDSELLRLYTGGSTGTPQIWSKTALNIFGEALFLASHFTVTPVDCIVATISPYHVYGLLYSIVLPLVSGARVVSAMPVFPEEIVQTLESDQASILISVPAHYRVLRGRRLHTPSLRLAFSSAGMLDPEDNREFCASAATGIIEVYGSTETGGIALRNRSAGEIEFTPYPLIDWRIERERLSIHSPFLSAALPRDETGFFMTGDRVEEWGQSGFQLKGRADAITKVGGKRVDMDEIADVIKQHPQVSDCLVLALPEKTGREHRIVALVEAEMTRPDSLKKLLAARLEPYALPKKIKIIKQMPVKENGKYDRPAILRLFQS